ncbi:integrase family protein [Parvularcula marina]|uniref:DUF4102 domain-containing protein n=1 Tax=Parvularcula marina TaxID=2292771 RepID=A0A371RL13_9PROT|nr:integrase family protein [Parvularcula marina]RFB06137.1 DUF4102 domain-containing protein [Parvularcula marina]
MAVKRITEAVARQAQLGQPQAVWDTELKGFGLVVRKTGKVSLLIQKNIGGRKTRLSLGHWPTLKIEEARRLARVKLAEIESGVVVKEERQGMTLREAAETHIQDMIKDARSSYKGLLPELERYMADWLDRPLSRISAEEVKHRHGQMKDKKATANRVFRIFRAVWNTARPIDDLPECPTRALRWYYVPGKTSRIEDLADWHKMVDGVRNLVVRDWLLFTLGSGLRVSDALSVKLSEVDWEEAVLTRPRPKGGERRAFRIPMSTQLMEILERRRQWGGVWAFPSSRNDGHLTNPKRSMIAAGLPTQTHDMRRTYSSVALTLGVPQPIISILMNHAPQGMTARYQNLTPEELRPWQQKISDALFTRG